jgi:hypothetical protein
MPTRRIFMMVVATIMLSRPAFGTARVWAVKTYGDTQPGSLAHGVAEVISVTA